MSDFDGERQVPFTLNDDPPPAYRRRTFVSDPFEQDQGISSQSPQQSVDEISEPLYSRYTTRLPSNAILSAPSPVSWGSWESLGSSNDNIPGAPNSEPMSTTIQLRRYLIEIMAYTFKADFSRLNSQLCQTLIGPEVIDKTITILSTKEQAELLHLSYTVNQLHKMTRQNQFNVATKRDRDMVTNSIIKPARKIKIEPDYVLDLIATYSDHQCLPSKRKRTLVKHHTPMLRCFFSTIRLQQTLIMHAKVIQSVTASDEDEDARITLGSAQAKVQTRLGFDDIYHWCCGGTSRSGFEDLNNDLLRDMVG